MLKERTESLRGAPGETWEKTKEAWPRWQQPGGSVVGLWSGPGKLEVVLQPPKCGLSGLAVREDSKGCGPSGARGSEMRADASCSGDRKRLPKHVLTFSVQLVVPPVPRDTFPRHCIQGSAVGQGSWIYHCPALSLYGPCPLLFHFVPMLLWPTPRCQW